MQKNFLHTFKLILKNLKVEFTKFFKKGEFLRKHIAKCHTCIHIEVESVEFFSTFSSVHG